MEEKIDLGACCGCGKKGRKVRNIILLDKLAPEPGTGWGCAVCGLASDGALAVLCDACCREGALIREAIAGFPRELRRVPIGELSGSHEHRPEAHEDELQALEGHTLQ
jgi:hypothetical protein